MAIVTHAASWGPPVTRDPTLAEGILDDMRCGWKEWWVTSGYPHWDSAAERVYCRGWGLKLLEVAGKLADRDWTEIPLAQISDHHRYIKQKDGDEMIGKTVASVVATGIMLKVAFTDGTFVVASGHGLNVAYRGEERR